MARIEILSEETIDKIAAGEVVEKPASIVKELVENSIDAGATSITVEIKDGGISFIRVTDNGEGIEKDQLRKAFCRHATSKLRCAEDLQVLCSLGFRGEALSSICAVANVEVMTKTANELIGTRYIIEGAQEKEFCEVGVPVGTTIIVRNVFFNVPARRKFLKTAGTEGGYISEICEHLALSRPDIAFKFVSGGQLKFNTSGSGDLKEVIYRIYGKDVASNLIEFSQENKDINLYGYLGKPVLNRSSRNFEKVFVNKRYVKSMIIANAVEEGYKPYLMQHKFPFVVLNVTVNTTLIDVNVHPTKMEIKFGNEDYLSDYIETAVGSALKVHEMIPEALLEEEVQAPKETSRLKGPEPFEHLRKYDIDNVPSMVREDVTSSDIHSTESTKKSIYNKILSEASNVADMPIITPQISNVIKAKDSVVINSNVQMDLFEDNLLTKEAMSEYEIIGQVFDTYWFIAYKDKLLVMDQHAAHEKIKYEAIMNKLKAKEFDSQELNPPIILTLTGLELNILEKYKENFNSLGYEFDEFGGNDIAIRCVPHDLYGLNEKEVFMEVLDELTSMGDVRKTPQVIDEKIASMACKSAVKGNSTMTKEECKELLNQLLELENPYNCPHGRPTVITLSKYELEKKFKRII